MSSGLDIAVPLDRDWSVEVVGGEDCAVTLTDSFSHTEVTLRGDPEVMVDLLETALKDLVDLHVEVTQRRTDEKLATLAAQAEEAMAFAEREIAPERLATPDEMEPGGWVRLPGHARWSLLRSVQPPEGKPGYRELVVGPEGALTLRIVTVRNYDTLPYRSAAEMVAEAPVSSDRWGNGLLDAFSGSDDAA